MPLNAELTVIRKMYVQLMKLPVKDLIEPLSKAKVIIERHSEEMYTMKLDKDRASYLLDKVIIPSLKLDIHDLFDGFLRVLEQHDETKELCEDLKLNLKHLLSQPSELPPLQYPVEQYQPLPYGQFHFYQSPYMDNHLI